MDNIQFSNMDGWRGNSSGKFMLTFKQIVLMHINRCVVNGSVEWHGGYWNEVGNNPTTRVYVHNAREVYSNSVKMLRACLLGYFDDKMNKADKELQEEYETKYKEIVDKIKDDKEIKNEWIAFKIDWHIKLFEELIKLSKRLNFFEEQGAEDDM